MTQIDKLERARDALDKLEDFIQEGCSARPEDKDHALRDIEIIFDALKTHETINTSQEHVKGDGNLTSDGVMPETWREKRASQSADQHPTDDSDKS